VGPDVVLMIDDEQDRINVGHTLDFVRAYRALGGCVRLEYAPAWLWRNSGQPDLRPLAAAGLAIVSSDYSTGGHADNGPGWAPYGGITPTIWQWTSTQAFNGQRVDFNVFKGSPAQLASLLSTKDNAMADTDDPAAWIKDFIETGHRGGQPSTASPPGYTAIPNNVIGGLIGKTQQDALRAANGTALIVSTLAGMQTTINGLSVALKALAAGGTSVDTGLVLAAIAKASADESLIVSALHDELDALHRQIAAGAAAEAAALATAQ
jgi:hypothetical protein